MHVLQSSLCKSRGPTDDMFDNARYNGESQAESAAVRHIYKQSWHPIKMKIQYLNCICNYANKLQQSYALKIHEGIKSHDP